MLVPPHWSIDEANAACFIVRDKSGGKSKKCEPGAEVAPLREHFAAADRSHHRAGDDRADAGHRH